MRFAAGRTIWATRSATRKKACACSPGGAANCKRCTPGARRILCSSPCKQPSRDHHLPIEPFDHLIQAFEQDQTVTRYRNFEELFEYCRYSANPVGRLVLGLCGYQDAERQALSDATCTALQLANFWQDVIVDLQKGSRLSPAGRAGAPGLSGRRSFRAAVRRRVSAAP